MAGKPVERIGVDTLSIKERTFSHGDAMPIFAGLGIGVVAGEFSAVLVPSGRGKTTLPNLFSGIKGLNCLGGR